MKPLTNWKMLTLTSIWKIQKEVAEALKEIDGEKIREQ